MSYCRGGDDSDVYVWAGGKDGKYHVSMCWGKEGVQERWMERVDECVNDPTWNLSYEKPEDVIKFLLEMRKVGFLVPEYAIRRLEKETK